MYPKQHRGWVFHPVKRPFIRTRHPAKTAWLTQRSSLTYGSRRSGRVGPVSGWKRHGELSPIFSRVVLGVTWPNWSRLKADPEITRPRLSEALTICRLLDWRYVGGGDFVGRRGAGAKERRGQSRW